MTTQLLFYATAVPVSSDRHRAHSVKVGGSYAFARAVNSVPLTAVEFARASGEYPIVFAGEGDAILPAAVVGTRVNENLFVDADGKWTGKYIPAFVRRYPFVFSQNQDGSQLILTIDEEFEGVNTEGRGERLFDAEGAQTQYLKTVLEFLQEYQLQFKRTQAYCARLNKLGLLKPMQADFTLAGGEKRSLSGFMVVDREKLREIGDEDLRQMFTNGELECAYLHLQSLNHFSDMLARATPAPAAAPTEAPVEA